MTVWVGIGCTRRDPIGAPPLLPDGAPSIKARTCSVAAPDNASNVPASLSQSNYQCHKDSECTAGKNGRCSMMGGGHAAMVVTCTYDACDGDADCKGAGELCMCGSRNQCVQANCHDDADCVGGQHCRDSAASDRSTWGRFCHTNKDKCASTADCADSEECAFETAARRWECVRTPPHPVG